MKPIKINHVKIGPIKTRKDGSIKFEVESGKVGAEGVQMLHDLLNIEGAMTFQPDGVMIAPAEIVVEEWQKSLGELLYNVLFTYWNQCVEAGTTTKSWEDFRHFHMEHVRSTYKKLLK